MVETTANRGALGATNENKPTPHRRAVPRRIRRGVLSLWGVLAAVALVVVMAAA